MELPEIDDLHRKLRATVLALIIASRRPSTQLGKFLGNIMAEEKISLRRSMLTCVGPEVHEFLAPAT